MKPLVRLSAGSLAKKILIPSLYLLLNAYFLTIRYSVENEETFLGVLRDGRKVIIPLWHQRFFGILNYARNFRDYRALVMISRSRDGDLIAGVVSRLGLEPVRGSSSRGGREALRELLEGLRDRSLAAHAVDGPQGPKGVVKAGIIELARLSGATVLPVYISMSRAWRFNSWDRFLIPKPFSRVRLRCGRPFDVPPRMNQEAFEACRRALEALLAEGHRKDDLAFGWREAL